MVVAKRANLNFSYETAEQKFKFTAKMVPKVNAGIPLTKHECTGSLKFTYHDVTQGHHYDINYNATRPRLIKKSHKIIEIQVLLFIRHHLMALFARCIFTHNIAIKRYFLAMDVNRPVKLLSKHNSKYTRLL